MKGRERSLNGREKKKTKGSARKNPSDNLQVDIFMWLWLLSLCYIFCPFCREGVGDEQALQVMAQQRPFPHQELHRESCFYSSSISDPLLRCFGVTTSVGDTQGLLSKDPPHPTLGVGFEGAAKLTLLFCCCHITLMLRPQR